MYRFLRPGKVTTGVETVLSNYESSCFYLKQLCSHLRQIYAVSVGSKYFSVVCVGSFDHLHDVFWSTEASVLSTHLPQQQAAVWHPDTCNFPFCLFRAYFEQLGGTLRGGWIRHLCLRRSFGKRRVHIRTAGNAHIP